MKKVLVGVVAVAVFAFGGSTVFAGAAPGAAGAAGKVDPTSGDNLIPGTIAGLPTFTSPTSGSIKISTATTAPGSYWLRFQTMLTHGSWEFAEGILMVH
jgi:hypothetical protein